MSSIPCCRALRACLVAWLIACALAFACPCAATAAPSIEGIDGGEACAPSALQISNGRPDDVSVGGFGLDVKQPARLEESSSKLTRETHVSGHTDTRIPTADQLREHLHMFIQAQEYIDSGMTFEFADRTWTPGDSFSATFSYPCVGVYRGKPVGARLSIDAVFYQAKPTQANYPIVQLPDLLYAGGYLFNLEHTSMTLSFFSATDGTPVEVADACLTYGSQNDYGTKLNENGDPYPRADWTHTDSETLLLPADKTTRIVYNKAGNMKFADAEKDGARFIHCYPISDEFEDVLGAPSFTYNATTFYQNGRFEFATPRTGWFSFTSAPMGSTPPPDVTKQTTANDVIAGQHVFWDIDQKVNVLGVDSLARYASFELADTLPTELDYQGARLIQVRDGTQTDLTDLCGVLSFDEATRAVLFTFDADWLAHDMPLAGETYRLRVETVVNQKATCGSSIANRAASTVNGRVQTTQAHVDVREPDPVLKTALPADGMTVRPGETIAYTLSYTNTTDAAQDVVLCDDIPAHTSYQPGTLAADANASQPDALEEPQGEATERRAPASVSAHWSALEPGQSAQARFCVVVDSPDPHTLEIVNAGYASVNNAAKVKTNQVKHLVGPGEPCITVEKAAVPTPSTHVAPGEAVTYKLTVRNEGAAPLAAPARNIRVWDAIPATTAYVEKSASPEFDGAYNADENALSWLIPSLAPGKSVELSFAVTVADDAPDGKTIANAARYHVNWTPDTALALEGETNKVEHVVQRSEAPAPPDDANDTPDAPCAPTGKPFAQTGDAAGGVVGGGILIGCSSLIAVSLLLAYRRSRRDFRRAHRTR